MSFISVSHPSAIFRADRAQVHKCAASPDLQYRNTAEFVKPSFQVIDYRQLIRRRPSDLIQQYAGFSSVDKSGQR